MLLLRVLCIASLFATMAIAQQEAKPLWWIFLVKSDGPRPSDPKALEAMQKAHIDNFKRLFAEKKLLAAGPVQDPTQYKRGIVVLNVDKESEIADCFKPDPYIQNAIMKIEASQIDVRFGHLETTKIDPNGIVENRLVIFTEAAPSGQRHDRAQLDHVKEGSKKANLAFYATVRKGKDVRAIALFRGTDDKAIQEWIDSVPAIKGKSWVATKIPQWLAKGVLGENL